MDVNCIQLAPG